MAVGLPGRYDDIAGRVPRSLGDLRGPSAGEVALPLHLCWSGMRVYDVGDPAIRLGMYQVVIAEGMLADVEAHLDARLLMEVWPRLRRLIHSAARAEWESRFPALAEHARAHAAEVAAELRRAREAVRARAEEAR
ncbi:hypothetical protein ABZU32_12535 [Sphaerisporangium sp. NPDC005288]|uniref:Transcriptional regulator n=1 Tax=Sphaerisporangium rhizosphaerae TaxID=2269375 RepID=A0ABW2PIN6_9ACTN